MKLIIAVLFLLPLTSLAQDCKLKKGIDDISSKPTLSTGFLALQDLSLSMDANSREIDLFFVMNNAAAKCFDEESTITVTYEGGRLKTELKGNGSLNCDGLFHVIFKNSAYTPSNLQKLATKKVVNIKVVSANNKITNINLTPEQQQDLMNNAACIAREAKTIL
jgi:hypothetical protein